MNLEAASEQGIKTAFRAYTDPLRPGTIVTYRCFFLNDEEDAPTEERQYPYIQLTAKPNAPSGHKSTFADVSMEVKWATHKTDDPKKATLRALYENCRAILDEETGVSVTGYSFMAIIIGDGGESDVDDNEQYITLPITVKVCGA